MKKEESTKFKLSTEIRNIQMKIEYNKNELQVIFFLLEKKTIFIFFFLKDLKVGHGKCNVGQKFI